MKGQLFTGRIYDFKKLKEDNPFLLLACVMRWPPRYINLKKEGIIHLPGLSPPIKLLKAYQKKEKSEKNWKSFVEKFVKHMQKDNQAAQDTFTVRYLLIKGTQIVLLCHEHADENCHRQILPHLILNEGEIADGIYKGELCYDESIQTKLSW